MYEYREFLDDMNHNIRQAYALLLIYVAELNIVNFQGKGLLGTAGTPT